jgi:hypothetical protein
MLHAGPNAAQVDRVDAVELFGGFLGGAGGRDHDPCVVERHIQPAELGDGLVDRGGDLVLV